MHAPVHCILAVWGKTYTDIFLRCSLPSQLAEGNIPALRDNPHARYRIFTTEADMTAMRQNAAFRRLESLIRVDFVPLSTLAATGDARDKLDRLAECHNAAIRQADREDASLIFLSPDFVFSTGCLAYGLRRWERGDNVVYTLTPRLVRESVLAELEARELADGSEGADGAKSSAGSGGIAPADLGEIALRHLHPIEKGYFRGASLVSFPIHVYWPAGDEGFVAHCAYLHPLFVRPLRRGERPAITIDADYVDRCCPDQSRIHVVDDAAKMLCVELSAADLPDINSRERGDGFPATPRRFARWAVVHANPVCDSLQHHWLLQHPIRIRGRRFSEPLWREAEQDARRFMRAVRLAVMASRHGLRRCWRIPAFWCATRTPYLPPPALFRTERALEERLHVSAFQVLGRVGYTRKRHKKVMRFCRSVRSACIRAMRRVDPLDKAIDRIKEARISRMEASAYQAELAFLHARSLLERNRPEQALAWYARALPGIRTRKYRRILTVVLDDLDSLPARVRPGSAYWRAVHKKAPHALGTCLVLARALAREGRSDEARAVWLAGLNAERPDETNRWRAAQQAHLNML